MSKLGVMLVSCALTGASACSDHVAPAAPATPAPVATPTPIPTRIEGRYALAPTSTHNAPLPAARVFVTLDASGAARVGTIGTDPVTAGTLVGLPEQVSFHPDDTPPGTPRLRDTVAALLGPGQPAPVLDDTSRHELLTSGCTHWPPDQPRAVSWAHSRDQRLEVLAFARVAEPSAARTILVADAAAPAIRLIHAADEVPIARLAVDAGGDGAVGLALDLGGAVALGDPICLGSDRSTVIEPASIEVQSDHFDKPFASIPVSGAAFSVDRDALVAAFRAQRAADLGDDHVIIHVHPGVTVARLVAVVDAFLEAGGTAFILHVYPDLERPARAPPTRPPAAKP